MKLRSFIAATLFFASACALSASATPIAAFTNQTITTADQSQLGRPVRNNVPQTWTRQESYPGVNNTGVTFYYKTYLLDYATIVPNNFIEVSFTDINAGGLLFISAYRGTYDPTNRSANWLGDLGFNTLGYGPSDALTFQVGLNYQDNLTLVVNTTGGGALGTNNPFDIYVNGYTDTMYDDSPIGVVTPEPSTFLELGTGLLAIAGVVRRRLSAAA